MDVSHRKGQVTAFVLIGLAILFVFLFLLYIRNTLSKSTINPATIGQSFDQAFVESYIGSCIDLAANDGFMLIGRQGGLLFPEQGGLADHSRLEAETFVNIRGAQVSINRSFGLINDSGYAGRPPLTSQEFLDTPSVVFSIPQNPLPWPDILVIGGRLSPSPLDEAWDNLSLDDRIYDGAFGQYALPPLCDPYGPNSGSLKGNAWCPVFLMANTPHMVHGPSIQESLASFIAKQVTACVNTSELADHLGTNYNFGRPDANVTLARSTTFIDVSLPIRFSSKTGTFRLEHITRRYNVRLLALYDFAFNLLKRASKDPFFRINDSSDYEQIRSFDRFRVHVSKLSPDEVDGRNDLFLVAIEDPVSLVNKGAWFFDFLVQNRAPVLGHTSPVDLHDLEPGRPRMLTVAAIDPDGEQGLHASLSFYNQAVNADLTITSLEEPLQLKITMGAQVYGNFTANLSVTDSMGATDWQDVTVRFPPPIA